MSIRVGIRSYKESEQIEVGGPFETMEEANAWIDKQTKQLIENAIAGRFYAYDAAPKISAINMADRDVKINCEVDVWYQID